MLVHILSVHNVVSSVTHKNIPSQGLYLIFGAEEYQHAVIQPLLVHYSNVVIINNLTGELHSADAAVT